MYSYTAMSLNLIIPTSTGETKALLKSTLNLLFAKTPVLSANYF